MTLPPFEPITTDRLVIRPLRPDDTPAVWHQRNDPAIAQYQSWTTPFPEERVRELVDAVVRMPGPVDDEWWMASIDERATGEMIGSLSLRPTFAGRSVELGYVVDPTVWGRGYATEAAGALVDWLVDTVGVTRVHAMTHPANLASVVVLERLGMRFEGHTRSSYWVGDEVSDDWLFGMTADDRRAWVDRPRSRPGAVSLVEVTHGRIDDVLALRVHRFQDHLVAPVEVSIAEALVPPVIEGDPVRPWLRAIEADGAIVGMVLVSAPRPTRPTPTLVRLLVDRRHQRRGIGAAAVGLVVEQARDWGADRLEVSWGVGHASPAGFYERLGFVALADQTRDDGDDRDEVPAALDL